VRDVTVIGREREEAEPEADDLNDPDDDLIDPRPDPLMSLHMSEDAEDEGIRTDSSVRTSPSIPRFFASRQYLYFCTSKASKLSTARSNWFCCL
jgi:hypothetical protein